MPLRSVAHLPPWRRQVMTWIMAVIRLGAGWLVTRTQLGALALTPSFLHEAVGAPLCYIDATVLGAGLLAFAWPRSYRAGFVLLAVGLLGFEWLWRRAGMRPDPVLLTSLSVLAVLAAGEWLTRRVSRQSQG
ncbi:MAG TPA: hypothetical protein VN790_02060 [Steroidobacteraceae bacterium]|nr:hypothetical protein [Steroidobacteraceae bacterium]